MNNETNLIPMPNSYLWRFAIALLIQYVFAFCGAVILMVAVYTFISTGKAELTTNDLLYMLFELGLFFAACKLSDYGLQRITYLVKSEGYKYD